MNEANVISVDPGVKTLGELCVNDHRLARISRKISGPGRKVAAPFRHIMNLLFGINRRVNSQLSGKMMILRLTCGTMFILMALLPMEMTDILAARFTADSIMLCAIGISMIFGLFSRITTLTGTVWFGIALYNSMAVSEPDTMSAMLVMVTAIFSVLGPGLYSMDRYLRRALIILAQKSIKKGRRKNCKAGVTFRAYNDVDRRVS